jgi:hypothetical protein
VPRTLRIEVPTDVKPLPREGRGFFHGSLIRSGSGSTYRSQAMPIELPNAETTTTSQPNHHNEATLFPLGQVVATPGALEHCEKCNVSPLSLIGRHHHGDWGDLCADDLAANESALFAGGRLLSSYRVADERLYVITEWNRSATTLLKASEY